MPNRVAFLLVASLLTLGGCATPEDLRHIDDIACTSYGFQHGTPEFAKCLQHRNLARQDGYLSST
jgi:hypothetical protein